VRPAGTLRAKVTVSELREHPRYAPFLKFTLAAGSSWDDAVSLGFTFSKRTGSGVGYIEVHEKGKQTRKTAVAGQFRPKSPFEVSIQWNAASVADISVNGAAPVRVALPFAPTQFRITSGTADVTIENVRIDGAR
jgi:hypothetical protein